MTPNSKALTFLAITKAEEEKQLEFQGKFETYWLLACLGGDRTSPAEKRKLFTELNAEMEEVVGNPVRAYLGDKDRELLRQITTDSGKDSKEQTRI